LAAIRRAGFYWSRGELDPMVAGFAMPNFPSDGEIAAALALVGRTESLDAVGEPRLRALRPGDACRSLFRPPRSKPRSQPGQGGAPPHCLELGRVYRANGGCSGHVPSCNLRPPFTGESMLSMPRLARTFAATALLGGCALAQAQFSMVPAPLLPGTPRPSETDVEKEYRIDAARHIYAAYPMRIHRGKLPPMMYAVMITDTEIDAQGNVINVQVVRPPAAATEVTPWVVSLIRRASPFPAPAKFPDGKVKYREIWLVDKTGQFQVDTLTEGQRSGS
jgi:hypothetical protein